MGTSNTIVIRSNSLVEKDLSTFRPKSILSRRSSLDEKDASIFQHNKNISSLKKPQKPKRRATISVLVVETEKDATTNKVVMSRSSSFKIDYCPDSPNNLEHTQIQYLTPDDHKFVTPKATQSTKLQMDTEELFPKFLPLPTCS